METHGKAVAVIEDTEEKDFGEWGGFTAVLSTPSLDRDGDRLQREEWIEPFADRYPLDIDHGMSVEDTIGSFRPYFSGDALMMDAYFASTDKAQLVRRLIDEGHIRSVSVAFITDRSKKDNEPRRELLNAGVVAIPSNRDAVILACKNAAPETADKALTLEDAFALLERMAEAEAGPDEDDAPEEQGHWCMSAACGCDDGGSEEPSEAVALQSVTEAETKAPAGTGDTAALTQAIHDAAVHLGAMCFPLPVPDEDPTGASSGANKSVEEPEEKSPDVDLPEGMTKEQFVTALTEVLKKLTPESPEEPAPVEETAAASPADLAQKAQLLRMRMRARHYNIKDN